MPQNISIEQVFEEYDKFQRYLAKNKEATDIIGKLLDKLDIDNIDTKPIKEMREASNSVKEASSQLKKLSQELDEILCEYVNFANKYIKQMKKAKESEKAIEETSCKKQKVEAEE